jgi:hypothetical protein
MNLIETITRQLSSGVIGQLSSMLGASESSTGSAITAAVPALLSALSGMVSSGSGTQKLLAALNQVGTSALDNLGHKLTNQAGAVQEQGHDVLNTLFGSSGLSGIVSSVARFANLSPATTQKLLSYVAPVVLSAIASKFTGKSMNAQGLASLFADEKSSIAHALPSGFSLADIPGVSTATAAVRTAARDVETAGASMMRWLLPLAGLAALALIAWMYWQTPANVAAPDERIRAQSPDITPKPRTENVNINVPDLTKLKTDFSDAVTKASEALNTIKDAATAEAALPKLQALDGVLATTKTSMKSLADAGQTAIKTLAKAEQGKLKELLDKVMAIPGVGDKIKTVVDSITAKLNDLTA